MKTTRRGQAAEGLDVGLVELGAEDDVAGGRPLAGHVDDGLDRRRLEGQDLELEPLLLRALAEPLDVVRYEHVVVAVDRVTVPGDVEEEDRLAGGSARALGLGPAVAEFLGDLEDPIAGLVAHAGLAVEDEGDRSGGNRGAVGNVFHPYGHLV